MHFCAVAYIFVNVFLACACFSCSFRYSSAGFLSASFLLFVLLNILRLDNVFKTVCFVGFHSFARQVDAIAFHQLCAALLLFDQKVLTAADLVRTLFLPCGCYVWVC